MSDPIEIQICEPGKFEREMKYCPECPFSGQEFSNCVLGLGKHVKGTYAKDVPGPRCPGPGTYVLIEKRRWEQALALIAEGGMLVRDAMEREVRKVQP